MVYFRSFGLEVSQVGFLHWVLNRGVWILGWQMAVLVGFSVLPRAHILINVPMCSWSCALHLFTEEGAIYLHPPPSEIVLLQFGVLHNDFTDTYTPFSSNPWSVPHLYRLSPLIQLSAQVTQILEDSFDQGPNEYVWKELRGASRLCTRGKHYSSRALNTRMAGCLSGNSTSGRISL